MGSDNIAALRAEHEHLSMLLLVVSLRTGFDRIVESPQYGKLTNVSPHREPQVILEVLLPWVPVQYFIDQTVDAETTTFAAFARRQPGSSRARSAFSAERSRSTFGLRSSSCRSCSGLRRSTSGEAETDGVRRA